MRGHFLEHQFTCPYGGEEISMVLDLSVGRQTSKSEYAVSQSRDRFTAGSDDLTSCDATTLGLGADRRAAAAPNRT
jgi:hypothetical protein